MVKLSVIKDALEDVDINSTCYFNKETKTLEQAITGFDGPKTKFYNWKINEVTNKDISLPDLSDYEVTDER